MLVIIWTFSFFFQCHLKYFWMESGFRELQNFVKRGHVSLGGVLFARKVGISWINPDFYIAQSSILRPGGLLISPFVITFMPL
jgi:hypothetical protein